MDEERRLFKLELEEIAKLDSCLEGLVNYQAEKTRQVGRHLVLRVGSRLKRSVELVIA